MQALGEKLDNDTLQTFTLAEQLSSDLTDLNIRIEGTDRSDPGVFVCPAIMGRQLFRLHAVILHIQYLRRANFIKSISSIIST